MAPGGPQRQIGAVPVVTVVEEVGDRHERGLAVLELSGGPHEAGHDLDLDVVG